MFADSRSFPLNPSTNTLAQLAANPLRLLVCDDEAAVQADHPLAAPVNPGTRAVTTASQSMHRAVIGVASVSLASVAEGLEMEGDFDVVDERGARVGSLRVRYV